MSHNYEFSSKQFIWFITFFIIGILLFSFGFFDNSTNEQNSNQSISLKEDDMVSITDKIKSSIVWVKYDVTGKNADGSYFEKSWSGSGVIVGNINNQLTIYTNRHVVDCEFLNRMDCFQRIAESIKVRTQDGKIHSVDKLSFSKSDIDIAILNVKTNNAENYTFAYYSDSFKIGDKVTSIGYPGTNLESTKPVLEFSVSDGIIINIKDLLEWQGYGFKGIYSDAYTNHGSSGGGLFDSWGNLIGITTWGSTEGVAIDFSSIQKNALDFGYCDKDSYFADGRCWNYCGREQVMDYKNRACYVVCKGFYCNSQIPSASDSRCRDSGYILGSDGYCHQPCESSNSWCQTGVCFRNRCYSQCSIGELWEDGSCRYNE